MVDAPGSRVIPHHRPECGVGESCPLLLRAEETLVSVRRRRRAVDLDDVGSEELGYGRADPADHRRVAGGELEDPPGAHRLAIPNTVHVYE